VHGDGFSAQGSLLQSDGLGDGSVVSVETLSRDEKTIQGISWKVAATNRAGYTIGLKNMSQDEEVDPYRPNIDFGIRIFSLTRTGDLRGLFFIVMEGAERRSRVTNKEMFARSHTKIQVGDVLGVQVQADQVTYTVNGTMVARSLTRPTFPLRVCASFFPVGPNEENRVPQSAADVQIAIAGA
jgi:hypothetical protein